MENESLNEYEYEYEYQYGNEASRLEARNGITVKCILGKETCCDNIEVISGNSLDVGALQKQPELFTSYSLESKLHNGKAAYVNKDGTKAIAIGHGNWEVQTSYDG